MSLVDRIASQRVNSFEEEKDYLNTISLFSAEYVLEINRASLKRLLLAFFREAILTYFYREDDLFFDLPRLNYFICIKKLKLASLLRFRNFGHVFLIHKVTKLSQAITDPLKLLDIVQDELNDRVDRKKWENFYREIANHLQNALLSTLKKYSLNNLLVNNKKPHNLKHFLDTVNHPLQFEQFIFEGHPYHPCAKTKLGFTMEDTLSYSPEFQSKVGVFVAAVKKDFVHVEAMESTLNFSEWFSYSYPKVWRSWLDELKRNDLNGEDYIPFPVHPWQVYYFTFVLKSFKDYLDNKTIILFNNVKLMARPTLSFRTLLPIEDFNAPYIKLPVAVQATSIVRTLSPVSTRNVPRISRILKGILAKESYFLNCLDILPEVYGLHLLSLKIDNGQHFSAIFRKNINSYLKENETAIIVAAFFEKSLLSDNSVFIEMMKLSGHLNYRCALTYFSNYTELLLSGYLSLYLLYGISLEGHQQNTFAIFQEGHIKRFVARDLDGIDIHHSSLKSAGIDLDIPLNSPCLIDSRKVVRNQLLYTVYQLHLGELVLLLANYFNCEEIVFWNIVKEVTEQQFYFLKDRMDISIWQREYDAILKFDWPLKALLRMRLEKKYLREGLFLSISNPLSN